MTWIKSTDDLVWWSTLLPNYVMMTNIVVKLLLVLLFAETMTKSTIGQDQNVVKFSTADDDRNVMLESYHKLLKMTLRPWFQSQRSTKMMSWSKTAGLMEGAAPNRPMIKNDYVPFSTDDNGVKLSRKSYLQYYIHQNKLLKWPSCATLRHRYVNQLQCGRYLPTMSSYFGEP